MVKHMQRKTIVIRAPYQAGNPTIRVVTYLREKTCSKNDNVYSRVVKRDSKE